MTSVPLTYNARTQRTRACPGGKMPEIEILKGPAQRQAYPLAGVTTVIGRSPDCDIVFNVSAVSREHAQILCRDGKYFLKDLNSRNQTFVNESAVDPQGPLTELRDGDVIKICDF